MLDDDFKAKIITLLQRCEERRVIMRPYYGKRSAQEQAELWCRSRSDNERDKMVRFLRERGADFLANCLDNVKRVGYDRWATNAIPGRSWHNYGLAVDCFNLRSGVANWDSKTFEYQVYAEEAKALNLESGYYWPSKDSVHVQAIKGDPLQQYSWLEIDNIMQKEWGR